MEIKSMSDAAEKLRQYVMKECYKYDCCSVDCLSYMICHSEGFDWSALAIFAESYDLDHKDRD